MDPQKIVDKRRNYSISASVEIAINLFETNHDEDAVRVLLHLGIDFSNVFRILHNKKKRRQIARDLCLEKNDS